MVKIVALFFLVGVLNAFGETPRTSPTWTLTERVLTQHAPKGQALHPHPVLDTDLAVTWPNGLSLELEIVKAMNDGSWRTAGDEMDWTIGKTWRAGTFDLTLSAVYVDLAPVLSGFRGDFFDPSLAVSKTMKRGRDAWTPYLSFDYVSWINLHELDGLFTHVGIIHEHTVNPKFFLRHNASLVWNGENVYGFEKGTTMQYSADLLWKTAKSLSIGPTFRFSTPLSETLDKSRVGVAVVGINVQYNF